MLKLPYGISDFDALRREGYHYVDRTAYIRQLEELVDKYIFFLRPRRFGKSLFISLLQRYYGLEHADDFALLFGGLAIGENPTPRANQYFVLRFDFSRIDTQTAESTLEGFLANIKYGASAFLTTYEAYFSADDRAYILAGNAPNMVVNRLFERFKAGQIVGAIQHKMYILIDEYDHFANELAAFRLADFRDIVSRNGFVRKFYESIKSATGEGVVDRLFVTGVSPLTLDSLTSGFNISTNLSTDLLFNGMMGFTPDEVETILLGSGVEPAQLATVIGDVQQWYDGYRFHPKAAMHIYNPDMVLYFAKEYERYQTYPEELLDVNLASDYTKVRRLFRVGDQEAQNLAVLEELITANEIQARITRQFSFEKSFTRDDFISLFFYMGIITAKRAELSLWVFEPPNYVIKQLYYEYFNQVLLERANLGQDEIYLRERVVSLAQENKIGPVIELVESILRQLSNRDAVGFDEKYVKAIFASIFYTAQIYTIRSEHESQRKYIDLLLLRRPPLEPAYQFAFELKYLKQAEAEQLAAKKQEALAQMRGYLQHEDIKNLSDLRAWVIIFVGPEAKVVEEVP
ncbi:MAG: AAA family ATPase [Caldilineaceae bacterium]